MGVIVSLCPEISLTLHRDKLTAFRCIAWRHVLAKGNSGQEDRAKVKLRVIEFELEGANASVENSIRQLTQALTSPAGTKIIPSKTPAQLNAATPETGAEEIEDNEAEIVNADTLDANSTPQGKKATRQKSKPKPPNYLHELNLTGNGPAFKEFAKEKSPSTRQKQYLVIAFWLKEYGDSPTVNADKMYTCFKTAGWSTGFKNWRTAFDNLARTEHLRLVEKGEFAINPLGEDVVTKGIEV
jgi:hypothetical protein